MDFFERQRIARTQSRRLLVLFVLAVIAIVLAVDVAVLFALGLTAPDTVGVGSGFWATVVANRVALIAVSALVLAVIAIASLARTATLRAGGSAVARELGGTAVPADTRDPHYRRLRNVVEEIAIASGVPVPDIFVLESEAAINAFAAGYGPADAAVAVTRGALDRLNRDELQGVVAHEFSHILNGDMRLNIHLMGVLFGILALAMIGRRLLVHGRIVRVGRSRGASEAALVGLALMICGYIGLLFARLIKAGVSRQRELLADASAVQFTRQASGLAGALKKIAGLREGSRLTSAQAEQVSHMLFGEGLGLSSIWASHPPLLERIRALDPGFSPAHMAALRRQQDALPPDGPAEDRLLLAATPHGTGVPAAAQTVAVAAAAVPAHVAAPQTGDRDLAMAIADAIPTELRIAARSHERVMALVLALLHGGDPIVGERQWALVETHHGRGMLDDMIALLAHTRVLHPMARLPLAELALPALRRRPRPQLQQFMATVHGMIHADRQVAVFEYCLSTLLQVQVQQALDPSRYWQSGRRKPGQCAPGIVGLLVRLAYEGHADDRKAARRAFVAGIQRVLPDAGGAWPEVPPPLESLDTVWPQLLQLSPAGKAMLIEAMVVAVSHDGRLRVAEVELLRTVCALLECPLPPLFGMECD
ncbi:MAG: M48 family metallopeptidase [Xanthomonadaceae bacterium]|nr:M48 family metallopeptidase [Xanthomonadaceae bacterium]